MKNCLIVLVFLVGCFFAAVFLVFFLDGPRGIDGRKGFAGEWRSYDEGKLEGLTVSISTKRMQIFIPSGGTHPKEIDETGHWTWHSFYVDSHLDAPAEIVVAKELKNEDLEFDLGHYVPGMPHKVTLVMMMRGGTTSPYPTYTSHDHVSYPPPRGLIRPGMLEWDLQQLPWHADRIDMQGEDPSEIYSYHSDRPDATQLLVTVLKGRVIDVRGGAEDTSDAPYRFPDPPAEDKQDEPTTQDKPERTWGGWFFDLIFRK